MLAEDLDVQVGQCGHELGIEPAHPIDAVVVLVPRFVVVPGGSAEGAENAFEVVRILHANVLLHDHQSTRTLIENQGRSAHPASERLPFRRGGLAYIRSGTKV